MSDKHMTSPIPERWREDMLNPQHYRLPACIEELGAAEAKVRELEQEREWARVALGAAIEERDKAEAQLQEVTGELASIKSPDLKKEKLVHGMNCSAWHSEHGQEVNAEDCTCGLRFRIFVQTEQTLHSAWRKRAEEAEISLQAVTQERDRACEELKESTETNWFPESFVVQLQDQIAELTERCDHFCKMALVPDGTESRKEIASFSAELSAANLRIRELEQEVSLGRQKYSAYREDMCKHLDDLGQQLQAVTQERDEFRQALSLIRELDPMNRNVGYTAADIADDMLREKP